MAIIALIFLLTIPGIYSQCTLSKAEPYFKRTMHEFSLELVERVAKATDNHFVTSGLSAWAILSTMAMGATGETLEELNRVLKLHPLKCFNKQYFEIAAQITGKYTGTVLERSSNIYTDDRFPLIPNFFHRVNNSKVCGIRSLQFNNLDTTAQMINDIVKLETHGKIDKVIKEDDLEGAYITLVDSLYFKGHWKNPFFEEDEEMEWFSNEAGKQMGYLTYMTSRQFANIVAVPLIGATVLELPYSGNNDFSMLIFLPDQGKTIASVIADLKKISMSGLYFLFNKTKKSEWLVQVPKFVLGSNHADFTNILGNMGIKTLFNKSAKLDNITDYALFVSNFTQIAIVNITDEGLEYRRFRIPLYERDAEEMQTKKRFRADRPFLFMIVHNYFEVALFTGAINPYSSPLPLVPFEK